MLQVIFFSTVVFTWINCDAAPYSLDSSSDLSVFKPNFFRKSSLLTNNVWGYNTENGNRWEQNYWDSADGSDVVIGCYSYLLPGGFSILVTFKADKNGFKPTVTQVLNRDGAPDLLCRRPYDTTAILQSSSTEGYRTEINSELRTENKIDRLEIRSDVTSETLSPIEYNEPIETRENMRIPPNTQSEKRESRDFIQQSQSTMRISQSGMNALSLRLRSDEELLDDTVLPINEPPHESLVISRTSSTQHLSQPNYICLILQFLIIMIVKIYREL